MRELIMVVAVASCTVAAAGVGTGSGSDDATRRFEHDTLVRLHMHENFDALRSVERLLVRGKLEEARELARGIAQAPDEPGMAAWAVQATRVRDRASTVASAQTLDDALRGVARLGAECAACHLASGALPDLAPAPGATPDETNLAARMARHRWATDRLWEGTIAPSTAAWDQGLEVLSATPLPATELGADRAGLARVLQRTADHAKHAKPEERAAVYGEILVACAACHTRASVTADWHARCVAIRDEPTT